MAWQKHVRQWHRWLAPFIVLPLLISLSSGLAYRLARDWGGVRRDQVHWLMALHEGEWLGPGLEPLVVLLNALGLLWMLLTGVALLIQSWKRTISREKPDGGQAKG
jgi:hypothetical protein